MSTTISESTYTSASNFLQEQVPEDFKNVRLGIICGSGLGGLVDTIEQSTKIEFQYSQIPGFVTSTGKGLGTSTWIVRQRDD